MSSSRDTEITLGVGKLLGLFFALVALCGLSLGIGYWLGWNSAARAGAHVAAKAAGTAPAAAPAETASSGAKSAAATQPAPATDNSELSFYQSVQQNDPQPKLTPPAAAAASSPQQHSTLGGGYLVQIAAVTREDDAKLLQNALQKDRYPVLVTSPGDKLFHVQVGPYANVKEAEEIRSRLINAGYRAYLKH